RRITRDRFGRLPPERQEELAIEMNVLVQIDNLRTHPGVAAALARGELSLYGWVYRIETGEVLTYDPAAGRFLPLGEGEPSRLPARARPQGAGGWCRRGHGGGRPGPAAPSAQEQTARRWPGEQDTNETG